MAIPSTIDVSDWSTIAPHYDALLAEHLPTYSYLRATINTASPATAAIQSAIDAQTSSYSVRVTAMSVMLDGQALTGTEIERLQRDPSRDTREAVWHARQRPWQNDRSFFDQLFLDLIARRRELVEFVDATLRDRIVIE